MDHDIIDARNAVHAAAAATVRREEAVAHLRVDGDALSEAIRPLSAAQLDADRGWLRRFAEVAARHTHDHRAELETALFAGDARA